MFSFLYDDAIWCHHFAIMTIEYTPMLQYHRHNYEITQITLCAIVLSVIYIRYNAVIMQWRRHLEDVNDGDKDTTMPVFFHDVQTAFYIFFNKLLNIAGSSFLVKKTLLILFMLYFLLFRKIKLQLFHLKVKKKTKLFYI